MNCFEHMDSVAVATCSCGRGLCGPCQAKRQPAACDQCHAAAVASRITMIQRRLGINCVFLVAYLWAGIASLAHTSWPLPVLLMMLAWGFVGFRWLLDALLGATRLAIFATGQTWVVTYFIGSLLCSLAGFVIVPVEIVLQWRLLKRLKAEAGAATAPAAALGAAS